MAKPISQINIGGISTEIADSSARDLLSQKVSKSGDTMTGILTINRNSSNVSIGAQNTGWFHFSNSENLPFHFNRTIGMSQGTSLGTGNEMPLQVNVRRTESTYKQSVTPTSSLWMDMMNGYDSDGVSRVNLRQVAHADGYQGTQLEAHRVINSTNYYNGIRMEIDGSGNRRVVVSDPGLWRTALGLGTAATTASTAYAAASHSHSYLPLSGGSMSGTGQISWTNHGTSFIRGGDNDATNGVGGALNNLVFSSWYGVSFTTSCSGQTYTNKNAVSINCRNGNVYAAQYNGSGAGLTSLNWNNISNKPSTFTPSSHSHSITTWELKNTSAITIAANSTGTYSVTGTAPDGYTKTGILDARTGNSNVGILSTLYVNQSQYNCTLHNHTSSSKTINAGSLVVRVQGIKF